MSEEWVETTLGEVALVNPKQGPVAADAPFMTMADVQEWGTWASPSGPRGSRGGVRANGGDTLVARITPCLQNGKIAMVPKHFGSVGGSTEFIVLRAGHAVLPEYLFRWATNGTTHRAAIELMTGTTGRQRVSAGDVASLPISLPPLSVQRRIVDVMEHLDNQIAALEGEVAALEVMEHRSRELLTTPQAGWVKASLHSICTKIGSGATPRGGEAAYKEEGVALIRSQNVLDGRFAWEGLARIDDDQAAGLSNVIVEEGDCLTNITGASVNRTCIVPREALPARVNQHVAILRADPEIASGPFINQLLMRNETRAHLDRLAQAGTTRQAITKKQLEDLTLAFPPTIDEQHEISSTLLAVADERAALAAEAQRLASFRKEILGALLSQRSELPDSYDALLGVAS